MDLLERLSFDAAQLICEYPPRWSDPNKQLVFDIADGSGYPNEGTVEYARWVGDAPSGRISDGLDFTVHSGIFDYADSQDPGGVNWYMNFADPRLFVAYGSPLMAQDELQVAEHPILGSLREALVAANANPVTMDEQDQPTPVTITGVQRRCVIDTAPNQVAGRHGGLYGNAFGMASPEAVQSATEPLNPATISHILAMAAPACGHGSYTREQVDYILRAACAGYGAARRESERLLAGSPRAVIHTGFWGCGAFGGNRSLMTMLQSLAADLVGVDMQFWAFDEVGMAVAENARRDYKVLRDKASASVEDMTEYLVEQEFQWGESDGN